MRAELTGIVVHDEKLFLPGGDIYEWGREVTAQIGEFTRLEAPVNKRQVKSSANAMWPVGSLRAGIDSDMLKVSLRRMTISLSSRAPYTDYVRYGTSRIFSRSARIPKGEPGAGQFAELGWETGGMYIPAGMGHKALIRQSVSGQAANDFIQRGFDRTAALHSSLRGMKF